jgi:hypothetical protein
VKMSFQSLLWSAEDLWLRYSPRLKVALHLWEVIVRSEASFDELSCVVEEVEAKVED